MSVDEQRVLMATHEILGFLSRSRISKKNIARLELLTGIEDFEFQRLRLLVLEIARVHPQKRRRWINLHRTARHLFEAHWASEFLVDWIDEEQGQLQQDRTEGDDLERNAMIERDCTGSLNRYLQELALETSQEWADSE